MDYGPGRVGVDRFRKFDFFLYIFFFFLLAVAHEQRLVVENPEKYFRSRQGSLTPSSTIDEIPAVPRPKVYLVVFGSLYFEININEL